MIAIDNNNRFGELEVYDMILIWMCFFGFKPFINIIFAMVISRINTISSVKCILFTQTIKNSLNV